MTIILALWALAQGATVLGVLLFLRHMPSDRQEEAPAGVTLILPVRDDWDGGADLIARLGAQAVPFRLILATSGGCPAAEALALRKPGRVEIVRAGVALDEGQKVHKLRAAIRALRPDDRYLVFIDADILPPERMVGRLLFPLVRGKADIATGYRLQLPDADAVLALVGAVEMQLATWPRFASATLPWAGAMAMSRDTADMLDLDALLAGRLSDDLTIGLEGWRRKLRLRPVRDLMIPSPLYGPGFDALRFGVRQYRHLATNSPGLWRLATAMVGVHALGWAWALLWGGWVAVLVGYGAAWARAALRWRIVTGVVDPAEARKVVRSLLWDALAPFGVSWTHLAFQLVAACSNRIRWGGWDYRVRKGRVVNMVPAGQKPAGN